MNSHKIEENGLKSHISCQNLLQLNSLRKSNATTLRASEREQKIVSSKTLNNLQSQLKMIDKYQVIQQIGKGAFGTVYYVREEDTGNYYALKTIDKHFLNLRGRQEEAQIERNFLVNYKHPLFIELYRTFTFGKLLCFLIEYVPNKTLEDLIENVRNIPFEVAMFYAKGILEVVSYMHNELNFVHRDLKPQNILIDNNFGVKLIDFSSVTVENAKYNLKRREYENIEDLDPSEVETDEIGTCEYCAPEMYNHTSQYSKSNDIWAIGCILYQLFGNGQTPFKSYNNSMTKENILNCEYRMNSKFTDDFKDLLQKIFVLDYKARIDINGIINHKFFTNYNICELKSQFPNFKELKTYFKKLTKERISFENRSTKDEERKMFGDTILDEEEEDASESFIRQEEKEKDISINSSMDDEEEEEEEKEEGNSISPVIGDNEFTIQCFESMENVEKSIKDNFYYKEENEEKKKYPIFECNAIKVNILKKNSSDYKLTIFNTRSLKLEKHCSDPARKRTVLYAQINDNISLFFRFDDRCNQATIRSGNAKYTVLLNGNDYHDFKLNISNAL